jgi:hypothetical protein
MIRLFVQNTAAMLSRRDCTWLKGSEAIRKRGRGERTYAIIRHRSEVSPEERPCRLLYLDYLVVFISVAFLEEDERDEPFLSSQNSAKTSNDGAAKPAPTLSDRQEA